MVLMLFKHMLLVVLKVMLLLLLIQLEVAFISDEHTAKLEGGSEVLVSGQDIFVDVDPKVIQVSDMFDMVIKKLVMGHGQVEKFFWYAPSCIHPNKS
jgi:hypothetical protein